MRAKINIIFLVTLSISMGIILYSCDNSVSGDPTYRGMIKGWVYDDSTKLPISQVKVWADGIPDTLYTDLAGNFRYTKISMPRGEFVYYLIFQKSGYADKSYSIYCKSDIESIIDSVFMRKTF